MHISVNANVSDESGANVYVTAFETDVDANAWKANIESGQWDLGNLAVQLQPVVPTGHQMVVVSGNIDHAYANLDSNETINIDVNKTYHVYMYAVDVYNNSVAVKHEYVVDVDVATTSVVSFDPFMQYVDNPPEIGAFAQLRATPAEPNVSYQGEFFRFYDQDTFSEWDSRLYADLHVNPNESVISGNVYTFAVERYEANLDNVAAFINDRLDETLVYATSAKYNANIDVTNEVIHRFYPNVDPGTSNVDMEFSKTYHVYSMVQDLGFRTDVVKHNAVAQTGTPPTVTTVDVRVLKE